MRHKLVKSCLILIPVQKTFLFIMCIAALYVVSIYGLFVEPKHLSMFHSIHPLHNLYDTYNLYSYIRFNLYKVLQILINVFMWALRVKSSYRCYRSTDIKISLSLSHSHTHTHTPLSMFASLA